MSEDFDREISSDGRGESEYAFQTVTRSGRPKTIGWSVASLVFGIASVITSIFGWPGIVLGILAIIFALISRVVLGYFDGMLMTGFILGIHGLLIAIVSIIMVSMLGDGAHSTLWDYIKEIFKRINDGPVR